MLPSRSRFPGRIPAAAGFRAGSASGSASRPQPPSEPCPGRSLLQGRGIAGSLVAARPSRACGSGSCAGRRRASRRFARRRPAGPRPAPPPPPTWARQCRRTSRHGAAPPPSPLPTGGPGCSRLPVPSRISGRGRAGFPAAAGFRAGSASGSASRPQPPSDSCPDRSLLQGRGIAGLVYVGKTNKVLTMLVYVGKT
jgi:hypothetical protein